MSLILVSCLKLAAPSSSSSVRLAAPAVASRLKCRLLHSSSPRLSDQPSSSFNSLENVQGILEEAQASSTANSGPSPLPRTSRGAFDVTTPRAANSPQGASGHRIQYIRKAFLGQVSGPLCMHPAPFGSSAGQKDSPQKRSRALIVVFVILAAFKQHYAPSSLNQEAIISQRRPRARPLLGPSKAEAVKNDKIHHFQLKPSKPSLSDDSYKNPVLLSSYVSEMGKILPRSATGLTWKSQRMVGKAIRTARAMGLMPVLARSSS